jgi:hypothetical protein
MPDNWTYVAAAYTLAAVVFGAYWLRLGRRERELAMSGAVRIDPTSRSQAPSKTGHPRPEPASRPPLP